MRATQIDSKLDGLTIHLETSEQSLSPHLPFISCSPQLSRTSQHQNIWYHKGKYELLTYKENELGYNRKTENFMYVVVLTTVSAVVYMTYSTNQLYLTKPLFLFLHSYSPPELLFSVD